MMRYDYDILVIGGGPGGYIAASYASQFGKRAAAAEKGHIGGCCLNTGCIPTKILLEAARRFSQVTDSGDFGITADNVSFSWKTLKAYSEKIRADMRNGISALLRSRKCPVIRGEAVFADEHTVMVNGDAVTAENVIIATGARPSVPDRFRDVRNVVTSDSFWEIEKQPDSIVIIGGGAVGCETASALCRLGTKVTVIETAQELLPRFSADTVRLLREEFKKNGADIYCGAAVSEIRDSGSKLTVIFGNKSAECDIVLLAAGREAVRPDMGHLRLECGEGGFIKTDANYRTSIENIYCIGDANGKGMTAHAAIAQAMGAVSGICAGVNIAGNFAAPETLFTYPAAARIGLSEEECGDIDTAVGTAPYEYIGYSRAIGGEKGFFRIIRDIEKDTLVGAEIAGHDAYELVHILAPYINRQLPVNMFSDMIMAHPTLSEGIKMAVESTYIRSPHM